MHRSPQKSAHRDMNLSQYKSSLLKTFTHLFHEHQDIMLNLSIKLPIPNPRREEILFSQYPMQKKGKTLGTTEMRRVRIQDGRLVQVGGDSGQKEFPMPNQLRREKYVQGMAGWAQKQYIFRINLQFSQRSPIAIYMKNAQQQLQLFSYLHAKSRPYTLQILKQAYKKCYKQKIYHAWLSKLLNIKMSKNYNTQTLEKRRLSTINKINFAYKDQKKVKDLIYHWHQLAVMKATEKSEKGIIDVKHIVSELSFLVSMVKVPAYLNIRSGQLKLWIGQTTHQKMLTFNKQNSNIQQIPDLTEQQQPGNTDNVQKLYDIVQIFHLQDAEMMLRNLSTPLSIWSVLQFQIDTKGENGVSRCWRSDRFYVMDYLKSITRGPKKSVTLWSSKQCIQIFLASTSSKTHILKIPHPPQHPTLPSSYTYSLTPQNYQVLQSQIPQPILSKYIKSINPQSLHLQYTIAYQQYLQCQAIQSLCFSSIHRLYQLLDIDGIIDKFYLTMPYASYKGDRGRGTVVYEILAGKSQRFWFYDAEKYVWRNPGHIGMRRLLSVIKAFDQMPRINFNQPFHQLCLQCLKMSQNQSLLKQKPHNFDNTVMGRESLAFFTILGILKCSSQLLLHQTNKQYLANNSLLFHYILKKHVSTVYHKFLHLQFNIQAYFGILSVGLFSELCNLGTGNGNYGGSHQIYLFILSCYLQQRKQQQLQSSESSSPIRQHHYLSLISTFLSLLQLFQTTEEHKNKKTKNKDKMYPQIHNQLTSTSAAYTNPYNYMFNLKLFVCCELETYLTQFMAFYQKYFKLCLQVINQDQGYAQLNMNMGKFYNLANGSEGNVIGQGSVSVNQLGLGELMEQLYTQFSAYKHKNQADIRKISIIIDHIHLGDCISSIHSSSNAFISGSTSYKPPCLHIQLCQQGTKLYQHQYIMPTNNTSFRGIQHKIQQKLSRLHILTLTITLTVRNISQSYFTKIDPKQIPSNVYIQQINEMHSVSGSRSDKSGSIDVYVWRYVALQLFIKDSCDVDVLQNVVPSGYVNGLLLNGRVGDDCPQDYKRDIIFANHYFRSFRLTQNNFNLLFAKLGWYGNHYLIPTSRITSLFLTHPIPPSLPSNPSLQQFLSCNKPQFPISQIPIHDNKRINQILFYTRCVYGRGIVPSIAYSGCNSRLVMESIRNGHCIVQEKQFKNQINQCAFNCCGNLVAYLLDNFQYCKQAGGDGGSNGGFVDFYLKATEQLPLIRYLTFRPLQFYLLQQITINLKVVSSQTKADQNFRNYSSNPQNYTSLKNIPQLQGLDKQNYNQQLITRQYKIIFTNHEISTQHQQQNHAYQFIADSSILPTKLYAQFMGTDDVSTIYDLKLLYTKLNEGLELPILMYFTLPYAMSYGQSGNQEQFGINSSIPIYLDAFMYLLQLNIMYYYVLKKHLKGENNVMTHKQKQKQKQKPKQKGQNPQIIGCRFRSSNPPIPNIPLSTLFPMLYQTKQPLTIHVIPVTSINIGQSPSTASPSYPIILNPLYRHYTSFAYIANIWKQVCILSKIITPSYVFYYVQEARTRIYRLMRANDVIFGFQAKKIMDRLYVAKFTDFQVLACKDCVKKELNMIL